MSGAPDITQFLPPSLNLPPHLSAHKYFFVCTLTVAAWDTLVLSPRTWRLLRSPGWPLLKIIYHVMRLLMPIEFIIVAVAFFDTAWTAQMCNKFYLFEPIVTAVLLALCGVSHAIRVSAIYDKSTTVLASLAAGVLVMTVAMGVGAAFHRPMPLLEGQGCIAGPKHTWVGIYWAAATVYFVTTFALAVVRGLQSLQDKRLGWWKLMLRDGLNLYGCIAIVHLINVLFWFIVKPTDERDSVKTIATSMTAVLTVTMTLRIILSVRGPLDQGGAYAGMSTAGSASRPGTTHHISTRPNQPGQGQRGGGAGAGVVSTGVTTGAMSLEELPTGKATRDWDDQGSQEVADAKDQLPPPGTGVRVSIERGTAAAESFSYGYKN